MNRAEEDYIKALYELTVERDRKMVKTSELAYQFGFTDQTVNEMIRKLKNKKLVNFIPYKGVSLTKDGLDIAIKMIRAHRLWEVFLTQKLGFNWSDVHENAEMLEHVSNNQILDKLYEFLGEPKYCQHGNPIPSVDGKVKPISITPLIDLKKGDKFKLVRVLDKKDLLHYLDTLNINLYDSFEVVNIDDFLQTITLKNNEIQYDINYHIASMLFVEISKN